MLFLNCCGVAWPRGPNHWLQNNPSLPVQSQPPANSFCQSVSLVLATVYGNKVGILTPILNICYWLLKEDEPLKTTKMWRSFRLQHLRVPLSGTNRLLTTQFHTFVLFRILILLVKESHLVISSEYIITRLQMILSTFSLSDCIIRIISTSEVPIYTCSVYCKCVECCWWWRVKRPAVVKYKQNKDCKIDIAQKVVIKKNFQRIDYVIKWA